MTEQIDVLERTLDEKDLVIQRNKGDLQSYLLKKKIKARVLQTEMQKVERTLTEKIIEKKKAKGGEGESEESEEEDEESEEDGDLRRLATEE